MDLDEVLFQKSSFYLMDFIQVCKRMASFSPPLNDTRCMGTDFCLNSAQSFVAAVLFSFICLWIPGSVSEKQQGEGLGCRLATQRLWGVKASTWHGKHPFPCPRGLQSRR